MSIILLLEDGVEAPAGLVGDLEHIPFSRQRPSESFGKLLEMIGVLSRGFTRIADDSTSHESPEGMAVQLPEETPASEKPEPTESDYILQVVDAIRDEDAEAEETAANSFLTLMGEDPYEVARVKGIRLYFHAIWNQANNLSGLEQLLEAHPNHDLLHLYVAEVLKTFEEHQKAAVHFEKAARFAKLEDRKPDRLCSAMFEFAGARDEKWEQIAEELKDSQLIDRDKAIYLKTLSRIYYERKEHGLAYSFGEASLGVQPDQNKFRYELGYQYFENGIHPLAIHHFKILSKVGPSDGVWNNYGASLESLKLNINAVQAYRESESLNSTVALTNLARKFVNEGFVPEAEILVRKAQEIPDYDKRIGDTLVEIAKKQEDESKKLENHAEKSSNERVFLIDFGNAWIDANPSSFAAIFSNGTYNLDITLAGRQFSAVAEFTKPRTAAPWQTDKVEDAKVKEIFTGELKGRSVQYEKQSYVDGVLKDSNKGLLVINREITRVTIFNDTFSGDKTPEVFNRKN